MIIKAVSGLKYSLTKTKLTETQVNPNMLSQLRFSVNLQELTANGKRFGRVFLQIEEAPDFWSASKKNWADVLFRSDCSQIGCARFNKATAAKIKKAVKSL
jgi:hypothetical protein